MKYRLRQSLLTREEADLDITPFMNLMIVLVPVLLLSMVFTRITVIDLQLPSGPSDNKDSLVQQQVEVLLKQETMTVNFPEGVLLRDIPNDEQGYPNYSQLSLVLQELKRHLRQKQADRKNISLLVSDDMPYHRVVSTMEAVRSYKAVIATSVVDAELFPDISFGDLPVDKTSSTLVNR